MEDFIASDTITAIHKEMDKRNTDLEAKSKCSQLWLSYQEMLRVARMLTMGDRTGSWSLHLYTIVDCLPILLPLATTTT